MTGITKPNWNQARRFCEATAGHADPAMTFQVFDDKGENFELAAWRHGKLSDIGIQKWLIVKAKQGCGAYVVTSECDGNGRRRQNVLQGRTNFIDLDGEPLPDKFQLDPHLIEETSPGRFHVHWLIEPTDDLNSWSAVQARLAAYYGGDPKVFDPPRVVRLPGFDHQKRKPFRSHLIKSADPANVRLGDFSRYTLADLVKAHPVEFSPPTPRAEGGRSDEPEGGFDNAADIERAREYLAQVEPPQEGNRNNEGYRVACVLNDFGISPELSEALMGEVWNARLEEPLPDHEIAHVIKSATRYKANNPGSKSVATAEEEFDDFNGEEQSDGTRHIGGLSYQIGSVVEEQEIEWLWSNRFPFGMCSLIAGYPDYGKSLITLDMAARVTTGDDWPNGEGKAKQGAVIIISSEDTFANVIKPRLMAAGADMNQIINLSPMVTENIEGKKRHRVMNIEDDLKSIKKVSDFEATRGRHVRLIVFDPLNAYFGGSKKGDAHKNADIRALLTPLSQWAEANKLAVVGIMHFNKSSNTHTLYRVTDSGAITAVARAVWFAVEGDEPGEFKMLKGKKNIGQAVRGLCYIIDDRPVGEKKITAPFIKWGAETDTRPEQALAPKTESTVLEKAREFLEQALADGKQHKAGPVKRAGERLGFTVRTLERAVSGMAVRKGGTTRNRTWTLGYSVLDDVDEFEDADEFEGAA